MVSVVHGPGTREGQAAELPPRPTSCWECIARHSQGMDAPQLRRVAMLMLRVVCAWRLEDIGTLFELHKGHVSREVDRARIEMAVVLRESGIELLPQTDLHLEDAATDRLIARVTARLTAFERETLVQVSTAGGVSESRQARLFMLAGGLQHECQERAWTGEREHDALQAG